jgi:alanyl-tRNA synthetase
MPLKNARELGAIGLFDDKYAKDVKIYFIGGSNPYSEKEKAYSIEFCGGPHVEHTGLIKSFDILKEEGVARGVRRLYVKVS